MAVAVFYVPPEKYKEAKKVVEADPYAEDSFAKAGYKLKEAKTLGVGEEGYYIYVKASEDFLGKARERLRDIAEELEGEAKEKVAKAVEEEEAAASAGLGNLFG